MKIFFDLDDVLFDTRSFVEAIATIFEQQGVSRDVFHDTYSQARLIGNDMVKVYSFVAHIDILRQYVPDLDKDSLLSGYGVLFADTSPYVFSDAVSTLESLKRQGADVFVVSFGIEEIQRAKIEGSGLMMFLNDFFVGVEAKSRMIGPVLGDHSQSWFIDDQPKFIDDVKTVFPFVKTIQMRRKDGRFMNDRHPKSDFVAENMDEVLKFINL